MGCLNQRPLKGHRTYERRVTKARESAYSSKDSATPANRHDSSNAADLRRVAEAWPSLPGPVRAGILAMVEATGGARE